MINIYLSEYNLLTSVQSNFTISQVSDWVDVSIKLQDVYIYTTRLYPYNGVATFYGFQDILRQNMKVRHLSLASLTIVAGDEMGAEYLEDKYIIYNEVIDIDDERDLLWSRFLTIRSFYTIPRKNGVLPLAFFSDASEQKTLTAECVFKEDDGTIRTYPYTKSIYPFQYPYVYNLYLYVEDIQRYVEQAEGGPVGKLLSFTCHVGSRSMTVYITDEPYEVDFYFRNSFNIYEKIYVYGTTKLKSSFNRKEAVSQGKISFYDMSEERKHEVETAPMGAEEAEWFNEFLASSYVQRELNQDWQQEVLISDITSEISDNAKDLVKMKFSWRYNDNARWISTDTYPQMFSAPYNDTFK